MRVRSVVAATVAAAVAVVGLPTTASAAIGPLPGGGVRYYLNDAFCGIANHAFVYGDPHDVVFFGDWDGQGGDTPMVRRGQRFHIRNSNSTGYADASFGYGDAGDTVLAGDWDGDGVDTLAVRRGNVFYLKNALTTGYADDVIAYGNPGDVVLVGDWDGDGVDTLTVRRGNQYFVKNSISSGVADTVFSYGDAGDKVLVGDWDGTDGVSLAIRRGNQYFFRNTLSSGIADRVLSYGEASDLAFSGDWDGDGTDTLGVRRWVEEGRAVDRRTGSELDQPFIVGGLPVVSKDHRISSRYASPWAGQPWGLNPDAYAAFRRMAADSRAAGLPLAIRSAYRTYAEQKAIYERAVAAYGIQYASLYYAPAGASEHQTGLALDVWDGVNRGTAFSRLPQARWVAQHAHEYGFIVRYPDGKTHITGYAWESWHLRWVGPEAAANFGPNSRLTLEEYLALV